MHKLAKWLIGIGLATIVALAVWFQIRPAPEPAPAIESAAAPAVDSGTASGTGPVAEVTPEPKPEPEPAPAGAPQLDVVRVAPDGQTVIAGRAAPGQMVEILVDGEVIGTVEADATGAFATVIDIAPSGEARVLTLRTAQSDAPEATVALAPTAGAVKAPAGEVAATETTAAAKVAAVEAAGAEQAVAEAVAVEATTAAEAAAADSTVKSAAAEIATAEAAAAEAAVATAKAAAAQIAAIVPSAVPATTEAATTEAAAEAAATAAAEAAEAAAAATAEAAAAKAAAAEAAAAEAVVAAAAAQAAAEAATAEAVAAKQATDAAVALAEPEISSFAVSAPVIILPPEGAEQAPLLVKPDSEGVTLMQPAAAEPAAGIVLDRLTYSDQGDLVAAGRGRPGSIIRIYANAVFLKQIRCDDEGQWQVEIASYVATSALLLRFDEVDADGQVLSRVETPFEYSPLVTAQELRARKIVVQKGDYLWKFAEQYYGKGWRYSVIFSANAALIRDPDLIYPGQIFTVPELIDSQ